MTSIEEFAGETLGLSNDGSCVGAGIDNGAGWGNGAGAGDGDGMYSL